MNKNKNGFNKTLTKSSPGSLTQYHCFFSTSHRQSESHQRSCHDRIPNIFFATNVLQNTVQNREAATLCFFEFFVKVSKTSKEEQSPGESNIRIIRSSKISVLSILYNQSSFVTASAKKKKKRKTSITQAPKPAAVRGALRAIVTTIFLNFSPIGAL